MDFSTKPFAFENKKIKIKKTIKRPLKGFQVGKYGHGYFIKCHYNNKHYGKKYFHNGWWNESKKGWFFLSKHYDDLVKKGAYELNKLPFHCMSYEYYDNQILVSCYKENPNYGNGNYYGGIWNSQGDGWLFHIGNEKYLEDNGAIYEFDEFNVFNYCRVKVITENCIVVPTIFNKYYRTTNINIGLVKGEWDNQEAGWIFNTSDTKFFTDRGAILI